MGKRRSWFSAVKRAITFESKETKQKKNRGRCWGKQRSINMHSSNVEVVHAAAADLSSEDVKLIEAENQQNKHAYSVALVTAMAAEAAIAAANAAAEVVRLRAVAYGSSKTKEDLAAVRIQTAFRGYMARRLLRALRGLMRLKSVVGGQTVKRQATSSLRCMQTLARVQSEIRARRIKMLEMNTAIQRKIQLKHGKELEKSRVSIGENWDESTRSKEQIKAELEKRQEAATRREHGLAYAFAQQQKSRNSLTCADQTFVDPQSDPRWGWSWLERWMAAGPLENQSGQVGKKTNVVSGIQSPIVQRGKQSPRSKIGGRISQPSPRGTVGTDEDSKSMNSNQSDRYRRHSVAASSLRDDESFTSSSAIPSYMASTESARAKIRSSTPRSQKGGATPDRLSVSSAKKRLSFSVES